MIVRVDVVLRQLSGFKLARHDPETFWDTHLSPPYLHCDNLLLPTLESCKRVMRHIYIPLLQYLRVSSLIQTPRISQQKPYTAPHRPSSYPDIAVILY